MTDWADEMVINKIKESARMKEVKALRIKCGEYETALQRIIVSDDCDEHSKQIATNAINKFVAKNDGSPC